MLSRDLKVDLDQYRNLDLAQFDHSDILISGASGMVGSAILSTILFLTEENFMTPSSITLLVRNQNIKAPNVSRINLEIKISSYQDFENSKKKYDYIFHCASPSNITKIDSLDSLIDINFNFTNKAYSKATKDFIYMSTGEVYKGGDSEEGVSLPPLDLSQKRDWYPYSKIQNENNLRNLVLSSTGASALIIRLFHTYGPGVSRFDGRSFADFLWGSILDKKIILNSPGDQVRTFLFLSDAIEGLFRILCCERPKFDIFNIGSSFPASIRQFAEVVGQYSHVEIEVLSKANFLHSPNLEIIPNTSKLKNLGWHETTSMQSGIQQTLNWIKNSLQSG